MNIKLTCKLFDADAWYFLEPLIDTKKVKVSLYRDRPLKIKTINNEYFIHQESFYYNGKGKFIFRLIKMIIDRPIPNIYVGIYEIPHGLISLISAKINNRPSVISIIGNPKYKIRNKGLRGFITNWIYKQVDVITVTGNKSKDYLVNAKEINAKKIFVLPNSVPLRDFLFYGNSLKKRYDLVTIGRLSPEKGLLNLIDIIAYLKKHNQKIKLGIAGKGPQMDVLRNKITMLKLNENIDLLGYVKSVKNFLQSGKIFITTSLTEGLPRTAIQAMLGGLPVVASNVGDMSDLVINGKTGILIDNPQSRDLYVQNILLLLKDDNKYLEMSRNACEHAIKYYSNSAATKVWDEIFNYLRTIKKITK